MTAILSSRRNERVQHMKKLGQSGEYRRECGEFLAEGRKLYNEALSAGLEIKELFTCSEGAYPGAQMVTRDVLEYVSPMKTPQDVVFSAAIPDIPQPADTGAIVLENIQDPGNVGTVLRTARAFGTGRVLLVGDCADPWSPKTVRAAMGAAFTQYVIRAELNELRALLGGAALYGASLSDRSRDIRSLPLEGAAVAIGNEGSGLTKELLALCDGELIIPMRPGSESLNAAMAAGIVMWELYGRRL